MSTLRNLRREKGLTLHELSAATGVALSTISNFENGIRGLSPKYANRLAVFFNVHIDDIYKGIESKTNNRPSVPPATSSLIKSLASNLGVTEARVRQAVADIIRNPDNME